MDGYLSPNGLAVPGLPAEHTGGPCIVSSVLRAAYVLAVCAQGMRELPMPECQSPTGVTALGSVDRNHTARMGDITARPMELESTMAKHFTPRRTLEMVSRGQPHRIAIAGIQAGVRPQICVSNLTKTHTPSLCTGATPMAARLPCRTALL